MLDLAFSKKSISRLIIGDFQLVSSLDLLDLRVILATSILAKLERIFASLLFLNQLLETFAFTEKLLNYTVLLVYVMHYFSNLLSLFDTYENPHILGDYLRVLEYPGYTFIQDYLIWSYFTHEARWNLKLCRTDMKKLICGINYLNRVL